MQPSRALGMVRLIKATSFRLAGHGSDQDSRREHVGKASVSEVDLVGVTAHGAGAHARGDLTKRCIVWAGNVRAGDALRALSGECNSIAAGRCRGTVSPAKDLAAVQRLQRFEAGAALVGASLTNKCRGFMQTPASAGISCRKRAFTRSASWRWLMPPLSVCMTCALQACSWPASPPAPSPTPNPHPQKTSQLKISVQDGAGVNNVEVESLWTVGNIGCAPIHPVSGAAIVKQVEVKEKVEKVGSYYVATIVDDRFLPDKCKWLGGAYGIRFMHDNHVLSSTGAGPNEFDGSGKLELTCTPPPDDPPTCFLRNKELFLRSHFQGVFNATVELVK